MQTQPNLHEQALDRVVENAIHLWGLKQGVRHLRPAEMRWLQRQADMTRRRWTLTVQSTLTQAQTEMAKLKEDC